MRFDDLKLTDAVLRAVHAEGYEVPTPIQQKAIPHVLLGRDLLGCAQTGTGKTAAFALPILCRLYETPAAVPSRTEHRPPQAAGHSQSHGHGHGHTPEHRERTHGRSHHSGRAARVLVLTPTRELALQIAESFTTYGKHTHLAVGLIFGGVGQGGQERMLRDGVDILVATPGRLMDLMNQRLVNLESVEVFVLDEADRMLDMGFIADIRKVIARLPHQRQNLMFSATMPPEIKRLADGILRNPIHVAVAPVASTAERVEQSVYFAEKRFKPALLHHLLNTDPSISRVLIFTRTKHGADRLARDLHKHRIPSEAIHGNKSQNQRQRALDTFKRGHSRVLVATDIAARGLDIELVSHVINYELPNIPESYVHRIGRTGRAGESGIAISFCSADEREFLRDIERLIGTKIPSVPLPTGLEVVERAAAGPAHGGHGRPQHSGSHRPQSNHGGSHRHAGHSPRREHTTHPNPAAPAAGGSPSNQGHGHAHSPGHGHRKDSAPVSAGSHSGSPRPAPPRGGGGGQRSFRPSRSASRKWRR